MMGSQGWKSMETLPIWLLPDGGPVGALQGTHHRTEISTQ